MESTIHRALPGSPIDLGLAQKDWPLGFREVVEGATDATSQGACCWGRVDCQLCLPRLSGTRCLIWGSARGQRLPISGVASPRRQNGAGLTAKGDELLTKRVRWSYQLEWLEAYQRQQKTSVVCPLFGSLWEGGGGCVVHWSGAARVKVANVGKLQKCADADDVS
jgi:hypothetical protein